MEKQGFIFIQMSDTFFATWNDIPKLPFPIQSKDIEEVFPPDITNIKKITLLDGLLKYVETYPEEKEVYKKTIAVIAFEAGLDYLRIATRTAMSAAAFCLKIAREYDPMNVEIITRQAVASYFTDGIQFTEFMKDALAIAESKNFIEDPFDYLTITHISYAIGEEKLGDSTWYAATDIALAELPPEKYSEFGEKMINICLKENYYTILNRHFTKQ